MAFKADDGQEFTNAPMARAHNARHAHASKKPTRTPVMPNPHKDAASSDSGHSLGHISCPHCGGDIDADQVLSERDPQGIDTPSAEF